MGIRRVRKWLVRSIAAAVTVALLFVGARLWTANFGTVAPGRIYRSGQMPGALLSQTIHRHGIQSVLNLRGANVEQSWYRSERAATLAAGATQIDIHMASDQWLTLNEARTLLNVLDTCDYPLLIHCQWGAERTGLVSAITELIRPDGSLESARRQFSAYFLFAPTRDGLVMRGHIERYESWLKSRRLAHSPERFRRWLLESYRPSHPNRGEWPFDPYPPVLISRPTFQPMLAIEKGEVRK